MSSTLEGHSGVLIIQTERKQCTDSVISPSERDVGQQAGAALGVIDHTKREGGTRTLIARCPKARGKVSFTLER